MMQIALIALHGVALYVFLAAACILGDEIVKKVGVKKAVVYAILVAIAAIAADRM